MNKAKDKRNRPKGFGRCASTATLNQGLADWPQPYSLWIMTQCNESDFLTSGRPATQDGKQKEGLVNPVVPGPTLADKQWSMQDHKKKLLEGDAPSPLRDSPIDLREGQLYNPTDCGIEPPLPPNGEETEQRNQENEDIYEMCNKRNVTIGTFNIKGKGSNRRFSKYRDLSAWMRINRIAIIAVQETKLQKEDEIQLMKENPRVTIISNSNNDNNAGIAFVLNKDLTNKWTYIVKDMITGRASSIEIKTDNTELTLINIYSPNNEKDKIDFYNEVHRQIMNMNPNKNLIVLGDFNFVEDAIDRLPNHKDDNKITTTFEKIKETLKIKDTWRNQNEFEKQYTYEHNNQMSLARIDRIYATHNIGKGLTNWNFSPIGNLSDHKLVQCDVETETEIYKGKGVWRIPMTIMKEPKFIKEINTLIDNTLQEMESNTRTSKQEIWNKTKEHIKEIAIRITKEQKKNKTKKGRKIKKKLAKTQNKPQNQQTNNKIKDLNKELRQINQERIDKYRISSKAKHKEEAERSSKYWYGLGKNQKEPATISSLKDERGKIHNNTRDLAKIAQTYYQKLMSQPKRDETYTKKSEELLSYMDKTLDTDQKQNLELDLGEIEIQKALKNADNGKAPGIDGIPFEFYKMCAKNKEEDDSPKIIRILTCVFNEIENKGLIDNSTFNEGTMFLLYKKGDKDKIENYRPITLSNTDYKIMTKAIATRLGEVAETIIHPNQAGFIPKRSILDNIRLSEAIVAHAEIKKENGCILALDQEKAYDRIAHDHLWATLRKFEFPEKFIRTIQNLYKNARTRITMNGVLAGYIILYVGVKQGCPASCLLYDIAAEPLACAIRKSSLIGFKIQGLLDRIIITMFADDTVIYLNAKDNINTLLPILELFCFVSNARFNENKYEALPIGTRKYIEKMIKTRKLNKKRDNTLNEKIKIMKIGESMRTLGAWIGHEINQYPQWNKILEKQNDILKKWSKMNLSFKGKELVLKALITSRAFYLATVNGIPNDVIDKMQKAMKNFLWENKRGAINWTEATADRNIGGLSVPDMQIRKDTITIAWIKRWLAPKNKRPDWAYIVDELISENITKSPKVDDESKISWILQSWHELKMGECTLPPFVKEMVNTARKYNIGFDALKIDQELKNTLPIWFHIGAKSNYLWNKKSAKCLRKNHNTKSVGEIEMIAEGNEYNEHCENASRCRMIAQKLLNNLKPKFNPTNTTPTKDNLDHTPRRKRLNKHLKLSENPITFDPNITASGDPMKYIRILGNKESYKRRKIKAKDKLWTDPVYRLPEIPIRERTIFCKGIQNKQSNSTYIGIWVENDNNASKSIHTKTQKDQDPELSAILHATSYPGPVLIKTESKYAAETILRKIKELEDTNWLNNKNKETLMTIAQTLRKKGNQTRIQWCKKKEPGNKKAKDLAIKSQETEQLQEEHTEEGITLDGARLCKLTQKTTYKLLLRNQLRKFNKESQVGGIWTKNNMESTINKLKEINKKEITTENVWKNISKLEPKKFQDFIWKSIHGRIKCGNFFLRIQKLQDRAYCKCGEVETEEHIILDCKTNHSKNVWERIRQQWKKLSKEEWLEPDINIIRGIGSIEYPTKKERKRTRQNTEIYRSLITITSWTLWKSRNIRIFENKERSLTTILKMIELELNDEIQIEWERIKLKEWQKRKDLQKKFLKKWNRSKEEIKNQNKALIDLETTLDQETFRKQAQEKNQQINMKRIRQMPPYIQTETQCECGENETDSHLILDCRLNHTKEVWLAIAKTWKEKTEKEWPTIDINTIKNIRTYKHPNETNKRKRTLYSELTKTLITITTETIWLNRNKRVQKHEKITGRAIREQIDKELIDTVKAEWEEANLAEKKMRKKLQNNVLDKWDLIKEEATAGLIPNMLI